MTAPLFSYSFLEAIGFSILNSIWQAGLIWIIAVLICHSKSLSASIKYAVFSFAQILIFCGFIASYLYFYNHLTIEKGDSALSSEIINLTEPFAQKINFILPFLSLGYFMLLFTGIIKWIHAFYNVIKIKQTPGFISIEWIERFVQKNSELLGLKKKIEVIVSKNLRTAITVGFLKPVILIPLGNINYLTTEQLEAVLIHELAHIKRGDFFLNIVHTLIEKILYFNPFVILISRQIIIERENACDDLVISKNYNTAQYADALLKMAKYSGNQLVMAAANKEQPLLNRIKRLLNKRVENKFSLHRSFFRVLTFLLFLISGVLIAPDSSNSLENNKLVAEINQNVPTVQVVAYETPTINNNTKYPQANKEQPRKVKSIETKKVQKKDNTRSKINSAQKPIPAENTSEVSMLEPATVVKAVGILDSLKQLNLITPAVFKTFPDDVQEILERQNSNPTEFLILLKEDEENKYSVHKIITLKIIANNGMVKTFRWSIDVYQ